MVAWYWWSNSNSSEKMCTMPRVPEAPTSSPLHPWERPNCSWLWVHIDHAGPFLGNFFLLLMDAHSKWLEVITVVSTSTEVMLQKLRTVFATHGLPEILVLDNISCFTSADFKEFVTQWHQTHYLWTIPRCHKEGKTSRYWNPSFQIPISL